MANFDLYKNSFEAFIKLDEALKTAAMKNKVSSQALIMLLALNNGTDLSFLIKEDYVNELINFGFAEKNGDSYVATGKGAILAKSLERIV